ncbi:TIGR02452 family protein [Myxococcus sp. K15C18031901]|uniref:TIGR02452 family protein n=1 Tax=Myxococcus dinghuensis TaxID=2906761 RepID=UPI0020A72CD8|nr:TIGR02452 family protein [Myxococcus dinghuensis]MCP3104686.1 TIGR02452 family protein [Myxococcus dinghuensis]
MSLKGLAQESLRIMEGGTYVSPSGRSVDLRDAVARAVEGTVLYGPEDFSGLRGAEPREDARPPRLEVTAEKTGEAARRLVEEEGLARVVALNFASAKNPGGGFLGGAKAQEEDLARCSALYTCLLSQPGYYEANRWEHSALYTDHVIYSPDVPFFRDESLALLEQPFHVSLVTAPAPNAGVVQREGGRGRDALPGVLRARARKVLQVMAHQGHTTLVLGAWGCGVFRNDPTEVARAFARALESLPGAFERVVFAVYERGGDGPNLRAFREFFG